MRLLLICLFLLNLLALAAGFGLLGSSDPRGEAERLTNQLHPERLQLDAEGTTPGAPSTDPGSEPSFSASVPASSLPVFPDSGMPAAPPQAPPDLPEVSESTASAETGRSITALVPRDPESTGSATTQTPVDPVVLPDEVASVCLAYLDLTEAERDRIMGLAQTVSSAFRIRSEMIDPPASWWVRIPPTGSPSAAEARARQLRAQGITDLFIVRDPGPNQYAISLGLFRTEASARQHLSDVQARQVRGAEIAERNPASYTVEITGANQEIQRLDERLRVDLLGLQTGTCSP